MLMPAFNVVKFFFAVLMITIIVKSFFILTLVLFSLNLVYLTNTYTSGSLRLCLGFLDVRTLLVSTYVEV